MLAGAMEGEAVYTQAARLCKDGKGKSSLRKRFESRMLSRVAPVSNTAKIRRNKAAVELAFADTLCLV
jgi:hypothetical protein